MRTHFKPTETFQYTYFSSCHPPGVKKGFIKSEAFTLLRTNSSEKTFEENVTNFKQRLRMRGYRGKVIDKHLSEVKHHERMSACPEGRGVGVGGVTFWACHINGRGGNFLKYPLPGRGNFFICLNCLKITDPPLGINNEQSLNSSSKLAA